MDQASGNLAEWKRFARLLVNIKHESKQQNYLFNFNYVKSQFSNAP